MSTLEHKSYYIIVWSIQESCWGHRDVQLNCFLCYAMHSYRWIPMDSYRPICWSQPILLLAALVQLAKDRGGETVTCFGDQHVTRR